MAEQSCPERQGEDEEGDGTTPPRIAPMPVLHLEGFDGPMDQLLDLAERKRIDLARLSPLAIVDQLDAALAQLARHLPLERRADLVILASRLLLLRSRRLLPEPAPPTGEAGRLAGGLASQADRGVMRAAADWMRGRPQLGHDVFARPGPGSSPRVAGYMALMQACLAVLEGRAGPGEEVSSFRPPVRDLWTAALARRHIRAALAGRPEGGDLLSFVPAIPDAPERHAPERHAPERHAPERHAPERHAPERHAHVRAAIAGTLLAGLELAREGEVSLDQPMFAGPIALRPGQPPAAAGTDRRPGSARRSSSVNASRGADPGWPGR